MRSVPPAFWAAAAMELMSRSAPPRLAATPHRLHPAIATSRIGWVSPALVRTPRRSRRASPSPGASLAALAPAGDARPGAGQLRAAPVPPTSRTDVWTEIQTEAVAAARRRDRSLVVPP